jgi:hypothetical protein
MELPLGSNVQSRVSEEFETVAYPGGVQRVREQIPGPPPDPQHQTRNEVFLPQTYGRPFVITSGDVVVPPSAERFVVIGSLLEIPIGRQGTLESIDIRLLDDDINTIGFSLQLSQGNLQFFQDVAPNTFERWRANLRLEEQSTIRVVVRNTSPGARFVRVGLNGWTFPTHKRVH